jgi:LPXTG-motif cell wall-anchored protein
MEYLVLSGGSFLSDGFYWAQDNWLPAAGIALGLFGLLWVIFKK